MKYPSELNGDHIGVQSASDPEPFPGGSSSSLSSAQIADASLPPPDYFSHPIPTDFRPIPLPRRSPPKRLGRSRRNDDDDGESGDSGAFIPASLPNFSNGAASTVAPLAEVESDFDATFTPTPQNAAGDEDLDLPVAKNGERREEGEEEGDDNDAALGAAEMESHGQSGEGEDDNYMVLEGPCVEESSTDIQNAPRDRDQHAGKTKPNRYLMVRVFCFLFPTVLNDVPACLLIYQSIPFWIGLKQKSSSMFLGRSHMSPRMNHTLGRGDLGKI